MDRNRYRFLSLWALPAPPAAVYDALERAEDYPRWWPQVREVRRLDDTTGVVRVRSHLPYDITFTVYAVRRDPVGRVLEFRMSGDIEGRARWTINADGTGTLARYEQAVDARRPLLRRPALPARPLLRANHRLMMRAGRRGLAAHLRAV